jgi:hypothetical protein
VTLRVTATDAAGVGAVVEQQFRGQDRRPPRHGEAKRLGSGRVLTLHLTVSKPATITLDILNKRGTSLRRTTLDRTTARSFATPLSLRHVRGQVTLRVTARDAAGASAVIQQQFRAQ